MFYLNYIYYINTIKRPNLTKCTQNFIKRFIPNEYYKKYRPKNKFLPKKYTYREKKTFTTVDVAYQSMYFQFYNVFVFTIVYPNKLTSGSDKPQFWYGFGLKNWKGGWVEVESFSHIFIHKHCYGSINSYQLLLNYLFGLILKVWWKSECW